MCSSFGENYRKWAFSRHEEVISLLPNIADLASQKACLIRHRIYGNEYLVKGQLLSECGVRQLTPGAVIVPDTRSDTINALESQTTTPPLLVLNEAPVKSTLEFTSARMPDPTNSKKHGTSACSSRSRTASPCALVRLGVAGLDCNTRPSRPADAAHYFARLRYRHRARPLAAMPAHGGRNPARSSSRRRNRAWTVPRARARCDCLPRPAGVLDETSAERP